VIGVVFDNYLSFVPQENRRNGNAKFDAGSGRDPRLSLEVLPGHLETLWSDQGEDIALSTVFAQRD
jgi:hypothetical protein